MGDISAEPSMEEILSSIKRIIAEEGDAPIRNRRNEPAPSAIAAQDEVLELSEPIEPSAQPEVRRIEPPAASTPRSEPPAPVQSLPPEPSPAEAPAETIVSQRTAAASRGSLEALSRLVVRSDGGDGDGTLEGLVREMLRPMLREWLDANLPSLVEQMVAREIAKITGANG